MTRTSSISSQNYSMSQLCFSVILCTVILLLLPLAGSESGEGSLDAPEETVRKTDHDETFILPYWNMRSSDFYAWMEELRAQGAYDALKDLARTYWAQFPATSYLAYDSITYPGESEYSED